ncbi:MAG: TIGR00374 family protein [Chloroflexus sp.]|uniref:lysylphosphatidylglycerol synthase transmembrane domain-containing protein n=1 Tax=Chloroflexus sp. TaxID=1904827 RepID=UPI0021DF1E0D|nr:lysylphosphatidylglycerol synthase transmembrane domain-containing protein [Chloroflexus sp.]GIV87621.1 MAG: TIGR00374 family protein [Chloroflexus sp.]
MRNWKLWLGFIISIIFLGIALYGLDLVHFWEALREANYWWLIPGIVVYFATVWVRTWRWQSMLNHIAFVPLRSLFPIVVIGYMGNNVYPARAGEVLRSYVLRRNCGIAMSASLATVVLERLFDGLVMLLFVAITLPFAPLPNTFRTLVIGFSAMFIAALIGFIAVAAYPQRMSRLYTLAVDRFAPPFLRPRIHGLFDRFIIGLQSLRSPREMLVILITSTLIWLGETLKYWFVMHAFPFEVSFLVLMLMTAVVNLFTTIPSTPGYIGTFDAPGIAILTQFGVAHAIAAGYTLVLHVALWLPVTLLGAWYMLRQSLTWRDMDRAAALRSQTSPAANDEVITTQKVLP